MIGDIKIPTLAGIISLIFFASSYSGYSLLGIILTSFIITLFLLNLGNTIPIRELILTVACLQWIVGPLLAYYFGNNHLKYYMYVDESLYMSLAFKGILFFLIGLFIVPIGDINMDTISKRISDNLSNNQSLAYGLIIIGFVASFLIQYAPASINFFLFLIMGFKDIGLIYLLFIKDKKKWIIITLIFSFNAIASITVGMFHDLILWSTLFFIYLSFQLRLKLFQRLMFVTFGIGIIFLIHSIKGQYRSMIWSGDYSGDHNELFLNLLEDRISGDEEIVTGSFLEQMNVRLNQGWIISRVMNYVPDYEPYANGETIVEALESSLLPRFLFPNKAIAGGKENFERFTGFHLESASMGISMLGEAYANYGLLGANIFMFFWGVVIAIFLKLGYNLAQDYPTLILWIPLLFLHVIKAETDFVVVLNHLIKSSIIVFMAYFVSYRLFKIRL